jgi:hypothetical protein
VIYSGIFNGGGAEIVWVADLRENELRGISELRYVVRTV